VRRALETSDWLKLSGSAAPAPAAPPAEQPTEVVQPVHDGS
jgi:hypothetical protein